jgi:hypothetical protein
MKDILGTIKKFKTAGGTVLPSRSFGLRNKTYINNLKDFLNRL